MAGCLVNLQRSFFLFVRIEKDFTAAGGAHRIVCSGEQHPYQTVACVIGVNKQQAHFTLSWMNRSVTDEFIQFIDRYK